MIQVKERHVISLECFAPLSKALRRGSLFLQFSFGVLILLKERKPHRLSGNRRVQSQTSVVILDIRIISLCHGSHSS